MPLVVTLLRAVRMLPLVLPLRFTSQVSALERAMTFFSNACASSLLSMVMVFAAPSDLALGVDDVDAVEAAGGAAVRHGGDLPRLPLAVEERPAQTIVALVAAGDHRVPELLGVGLVGDVAQHRAQLAVLDLVEELAAELEVVALLVDGVGAVADDEDALLDLGDELLRGELVLAGRERDIGHALELHVVPAVGVTAAVGLLLADDVGLVAGLLVVHQDAVLDEVPALALHALVVVADGAERAHLRLVGEDVDQRAAVLERLALPLVEGGEARAGVVGLVAEHAVELGGVADRLVDGEA